MLAGGTPWQSFSIAGARQGLSDPRGALTLKYVELANVIDQTRQQNQRPPATIIWENVPGVLSDRSNAFGCLLGALAGESRPLEPPGPKRSEEHTSELQSLMRISYAVFCLKKKTNHTNTYATQRTKI